MFWLGTLIFVVLITSGTARDSSGDGITPGTKQTNCTCGWANRIGRRIIGGQETEVNEFPMMAGIILRRLHIPNVVDKRNKLICGGTLITHRHVVTAGHCTHDPKLKQWELTNLGVVLGAHSLKKLKYSDPNVMRSPEQLILHPSYRPMAQYDVAIIVLPYVEFSQIIGPACLPTERFDVVSRMLTLIGWGFTSPRGPGSDVLKKTNILGFNHEQCLASFGSKLPAGLREYQVCTYLPATGQCLDDSGGPILWLDPLTNRYTLVALPSFVAKFCIIYPSVNSDISYFEPWIQQVISETYPEEKTCARVD